MTSQQLNQQYYFSNFIIKSRDKQAKSEVDK